MVRRIFYLALFFITLHIGCFAQTADMLPLKLRVGTYNVGHFNQGKLGGFQVEGRQAQVELNNWKRWIGQQSLDIFVVNEWNQYFDKDSVFHAADELLKPYYSQVYFGKENRWIYNGIATNYVLQNIRQEKWDGDYYAVLGDLIVGQKKVTIISTHIPWQKEWHQQSLEALITHLKQYEYFICMGDMNAVDAAQQKFVEAGFNMANGGAMGWFTTSGGAVRAAGRDGGMADTSIDNIVTSSNIKIFNVSAPTTGLNDRDHLPLLAELVISW